MQVPPGRYVPPWYAQMSRACFGVRFACDVDSAHVSCDDDHVPPCASHIFTMSTRTDPPPPLLAHPVNRKTSPAANASPWNTLARRITDLLQGLFLVWPTAEPGNRGPAWLRSARPWKSGTEPGSVASTAPSASRPSHRELPELLQR